MSHIKVDGLHKHHGTLEVLRGVNLSVSEGEVAAIIGPSGSGKSTFLRCLNGLEDFHKGCVTIGEIKLDGVAKPAIRARISRRICLRVGMVFQSFNLFPHRSVLQNVVEGPIYVLGMARDRAEDRARTLLDRVGLSDKLHAMPRQLSGGQQQRVAIARALAMGPKAMLFDEPTSALDPRMTAEVLSVMADLANDGLTMIVVTHAMSFARKVANTVHVFGDGIILESGPPDRIFDCPSHDSTKALLAEVRAV